MPYVPRVEVTLPWGFLFSETLFVQLWFWADLGTDGSENWEGGVDEAAPSS